LSSEEYRLRQFILPLDGDYFADSFQILSISVYYASGHAKRGLLNEGQHRRVSIHHGFLNLADRLREEVVGVRSGEEHEHSHNEKTLVEGGLKLDSGQSTAGKKGGRTFVTG
jgi:hypothetical protein